jgi:hypothetical protein
LLPDYIEANPAECKTWDVFDDARGSLIEPHTNRQIPLGTQDIRGYLNSTPEERTGVGGIPKTRRFATIGPENRYSSVLVIEKEGFDALLSRAAIRELYDIAIASTKGLSTVAARRAVDQLSARGAQVFGLHDFDVTGFRIFGTLAKDSRRYRFDNAVPTLDIGLRLGDVQEMDLQSEPVTVSGDWFKRAETLAAHGATAAEIDFLKTRRVELNAMTSLQLVDLIKRKLAELGVKKVIPDAAVVEHHARHWLEIEQDGAWQIHATGAGACGTDRQKFGSGPKKMWAPDRSSASSRSSEAIVPSRSNALRGKRRSRSVRQK